MTDPNRSPGYSFTSLRVRRAQCETSDDAGPGQEGQLSIAYRDSVRVDGKRITILQHLQVGVHDPADNSKTFVLAQVDLEGIFEGASETNIDPTDFANNHAPGVLFPFAREWIHKLTSSVAPWPPILLPPMNVLQLRAQVAGQPPAPAPRT